MLARAPLWIAALTAVPCAPVVALAGPAEAEALLEQAEQALRAGDTTRAVLFLEQAYAADPDPRYVANLGLVYERMGQYADAAAAFERYLASDPEASKRSAAESALARLRPEGLIVSRPPGARVHIDGAEQPAGVTPLRTRLLAGPHLARLHLDGYAPADAAVPVEPGQLFQVDVELVPEPVDHGRDHRGAAYACLGGGAGALAAAGALAWLTADAIDERDAAGRVDAAADTGARAAALDAWSDAQDRANGYLWGGVVLGVAGVAAMVTGGYLLATAPDADGPAVGLAPGPDGVTVYGRF